MQFFQDHWIEIVASLALLQPWIAWAWKKYIRKGEIDPHKTGLIEIGYSGSGPAVGLHGTLRALHQDQFIQNIIVTVIKQKDSSRHLFEWGSFGPDKLVIGGKQELSLPSGFMVTTTQPHRYYIQFLDRALGDEMRPHINRVREDWTKVVLDASEKQQITVASLLATQTYQQATADLFGEFSKTSPPAEVQKELDRLCYWESGSYSIEMQVNTSRPDRSSNEKWTFELSKTDFKSLRTNALKMVQEVCGQYFGQYYIAYVKYD